MLAYWSSFIRMAGSCEKEKKNAKEKKRERERKYAH